MATAGYISAGQYPMMGQSSGYEIDPITQQAYPASIANYIPAAAHGQQQIFVTTGQPVQMIPGHGGAMYPQVGFRGAGPNMYMQHPSQNVMHLPYTGDLHAPPAYSEMDSPRFQNPRSRRSSMSMSLSNGPYGFPNPQMSAMDYAYVENCMLCRANHPPPHPHGPSMNMHEMPPMSSHRHMSMDDSHSVSGKTRGSAYSYEGPMCDPLDFSPGFRGRDRREPSWDYRSKSQVRSRTRSQGPMGRSARVPINGIQVSEISDDDSDDTASRGGRLTNYSNPQRRANHSRTRSSTRGPRTAGSTANSNYL